MQDELVARVARELASFTSPWEDVSRRGDFIAFVLPRIVTTLDLLPAATPESRLLELGAEPFAESLCLSVVWPGKMTHANYSGTGERHGQRTLIEIGGARTRTFDYDLFNVETDEFPYPDGSFDVVIFSEMLEHLAINPVWALAEIHRVLKPGGHMILTTPNALSIERVGCALTGRRPIVDLYNPAFGYGARHNREFSPVELRVLLEETGFDIEEFTARDPEPAGHGERLRRAVLRQVLRPFSRTSRRAHLFVRARRGAVFRWRFPQLLFTEPNLYRYVRYPWVEMGVNDAIQCGHGWGPAEQLPDGGWVRRVRGVETTLPGGSATLRAVDGGSRVVVQLRGEGRANDAGTRVRVAVAACGALDTLIGVDSWVAPPDRWSDVEVQLTRPTVDGEHLLVNVAVEPGDTVAVRRIALS